MCIIIKQDNKEIKLKRLKHFNSHIHKRFYCDSNMNIWYKPKGQDIKQVNMNELDLYANEYPSSIRHIYQLKDFYRFVKFQFCGTKTPVGYGDVKIVKLEDASQETNKLHKGFYDKPNFPAFEYGH